MSLNSSSRRSTTMLIALTLVTAGCKDQNVAPTTTATDSTESVAKEPETTTPPSPQPTEAATAVSDPHQNVDLSPTANASPSAAVGDGRNTLVVKGIAFTVPDGWKQEKPSSTRRVAQFVLPGDAGSATLVITYFGVNGAGPRDANIERWVGLVAVADEAVADAKPESETVSHNGLEHTVVVATGTVSAPSMRPGAPPVAPKLTHTLYGVILEGGPEGPLYLKAVGPAGTIAAQTPAIEAFIKSARKAE